MPVQTTYPGVYVQELPSGVHTIAGVSTSVTAFVGAAVKGPINEPIRVFSFEDYVRAFGPPLDADRPMGHAVSQYFGNGGSEAVIVRVIASDAGLATVTLKDRESTAKNILKLDASGKGAWANRQNGVGVDVSVDGGGANADDLFSLTVAYKAFDQRANAAVVVAEEGIPEPLDVAEASAIRPQPARRLEARRPVAGDDALRRPEGHFDRGRCGRVRRLLGSKQHVASRRGLRGAIDVILFPTETAPGAAPVDEDVQRDRHRAERRVGRQNVGANAATTTNSSNIIKIESSSQTPDSSVIVMPAATSDASQTLKLGLAFGGTEVSGAADYRPAATTTGLTGGTEGSAVTAGDVVPADQRGGIYALSKLRFPRFNLLCLPGMTSDDTTQVQAALKYCADQRGFLIVDPPADSWAGPGDRSRRS